MKKVIATAVGFFGQLRQEGDPFEVPDDAKATWFKDADPKPAKDAKGKAPKPEAGAPKPEAGADESLT